MLYNEQLSPERIFRLIRALLVLKIDNARLTLAEKLTHLCGMLAIAFVGLLLGVAVIVFMALALVEFLADYLAIYWCFMIVAGLVVALFAVVWLLREKIIFNPLARFLSKLLCDQND